MAGQRKGLVPRGSSLGVGGVHTCRGLGPLSRRTSQMTSLKSHGERQGRRRGEMSEPVTQPAGGASWPGLCGLAQSSLKNQTSTTSPAHPILRRYNPDVSPDRPGRWRLSSRLQSQEVGRSECQFQPWVCSLTSCERLSLRTN